MAGLDTLKFTGIGTGNLGKGVIELDNCFVVSFEKEFEMSRKN